MRRGTTLIVFLLIFTLLGSCTSSGLPSPTPAPSPTATPVPIPEAVTRPDVPAYFAPGLDKPGAIPARGYRIGIVVGNSFKDAALRGEFERLCGQYEEAGLDISFELSIASVSQQGVVTNLLASGIDLLILSPGEDAPALGALCEQAGVPYITMDCRAGTPGEGKYVCSIERDEYLVGVLTGLSIADTLAQATGKPQGNIGEIVGDVSHPATVLRSAGLRRALSAYPDIRVVCSVTTSNDSAYHAAVNVMKAYRQGELSGIVVCSDAAALETLQAVVNYGRDELRGRIWSAGGTKAGLTGVWHGDFAQTVELTAQTGMMALEYAVQYLNGSGDIPAAVCSVTRAFSASTQEQKDEIAQLIARMEELGFAACMDNQGRYDLFWPEAQLAQVYPLHYYETGDVQSYLAEYPPYTTQDAVYPA